MNSLSSLDEAHYVESNFGHILNPAQKDSKQDQKYQIKFGFENKLDYRIMDTLYQAGLVDAHDRSQDFVPSVPTKLVTSLDDMNKHHSLRLDYVLVSPALLKHMTLCHVIKDESTHKLSDHYPVRCNFGG